MTSYFVVLVGVLGLLQLWISSLLVSLEAGCFLLPSRDGLVAGGTLDVSGTVSYLFAVPAVGVFLLGAGREGAV